MTVSMEKIYYLREYSKNDYHYLAFIEYKDSSDKWIDIWEKQPGLISWCRKRNDLPAIVGPELLPPPDRKTFKCGVEPDGELDIKFKFLALFDKEYARSWWNYSCGRGWYMDQPPTYLVKSLTDAMSKEAWYR